MEKMDQQMEQNMVIDYKYIYILIMMGNVRLRLELG